MLIVLLIVIAVIIIWLVSVYNNLIQARNKVKNSIAQIDTQLQRRFDLIPNLVETVKGYASHESELLEKLTASRTGYMNAQNSNERLVADTQLNSTLKSLFAVAESYPDLKANTNFLSLQNDLKSTEDKIAFSRQFYNDTVTIYNNKLQVFPTNLIAKMFEFKEEKLFSTDEAAKAAPKVQF